MKQKLIFLAALCAALSGFSAEYFVDASRPDDTGFATNWAAAKKNIQAAVDLTANGDTVWVTNGTYVLSAEISVTKAIIIRSVNGPEVTIVDGNGATRCFNLSSIEGRICGITMARGVEVYGAGMYGGTASNCIFLGNVASFGGGVANGVANNCIFTNNATVSFGGGMIGADQYGGGLYSGQANNCLFVKNSAFAGGGVMDATVHNCIFLNNSAVAGGGAENSTIFNSTFVGNEANGSGAMQNSTAYNCIFYTNLNWFGDVQDVYDEAVYNSCSVNLTHGENGNITNAPLFVDAANGDFRLQSNSPCINWGDNSVVTNATDLDGNTRIVEGTVDMGAHEYQGTVGLTDSDNDGINDDWERTHGGNQNPDRTCSNGVNTILQAYIVGLDPNDPESKFSFSVDRSSPFGSVLRWQSVSGREYSVYYSTNLVNGFIPLINHLVTGEGAYIDEIYEYNGPRYYKIDVQIDDNPDDNITPPSPLI